MLVRIENAKNNERRKHTGLRFGSNVLTIDSVGKL